MNWLRKLQLRFRALFAKRKLDAEMNEEMRSHVELQKQENIANGMAPEEARYAALRQFGHVDGIKEIAREQREGFVSRHVSLFAQDLRFAVRQLRKNPGFTTVAVLTLALGIGANTALFSVVDKVILRPLPMKDAGRLQTIREVNPQEARNAPGVSGPVFQELLAFTNVFEDLAACKIEQLALMREGGPQLIWGADVTPGFFSWFRAKPLLGRTFAAGDGAPGSRDLVVLNHAFWQSEFGGDPEIIGKAVPLSNEPFTPMPGTEVRSFTVVGVMPPEFRFPNWNGNRCDFWRPRDIAAEHISRPEIQRWVRNWTMLARLQPGVSAIQALPVLDTLAQRNAADFPQTSKDWRFETRPLSSLFHTADYRLTVDSLSVAIGVVLLLACANTANLLLARARNRNREFAIRAAVGAGRGRLIRQLLTESVVLAALGALAGSLIAIWGVHILSAHLPGELPVLREITLDGSALLFGILLALGAGIIFGLAPAWRVARPTAGEMLRDAGYGQTTRPERVFFQRGLVVGQIALSLALLVGAGLMLRSVSRFLNVEPGYDPKGLLRFMVTHANEQPASIIAKTRQLREAFEALPGVTAATITTYGRSGEVKLPGRDTIYETQPALVGVGDADYFAVWRIPLTQGRRFTQEDTANTTSALINEAMAKTLWPDKSALGQWFNTRDGSKRLQVVGVVGDTVENPEKGAQPRFYEPYERIPHLAMSSVFTLRIATDPTTLIPAVRRTLWELDRGTIPPEMWLPEGQFRAQVKPRQTFLTLLGFFALTGVALAAIGIYGLLAHLVARRTREIGVRMALGATRSNVLALTLRQGGRLIALGVALGLVMSLAATRFIQSKLFGISPVDPVTLLAVVTLLSLIALLACWLPARRASRVDPMVALRYE